MSIMSSPVPRSEGWNALDLFIDAWLAPMLPETPNLLEFMHMNGQNNGITLSSKNQFKRQNFITKFGSMIVPNTRIQ
jgi:hypothetical protein